MRAFLTSDRANLFFSDGDIDFLSVDDFVSSSVGVVSSDIIEYLFEYHHIQI